MIGRLRRAPKAPLSVAGILATPLFFVALMAFSLLLDEPTVTIRNGSEVLGDPSRGLVATIYLCSFAVTGAIVLVGVGALLLSTRVAVFVPCVASILVTIALLIPLDGWQADHTELYPDGVDLIPRSDPSDLILRGEWEENARVTAEEIGRWTIVIASVAMLLTVALRIRRRRTVPPPPPPPPWVAGDPQVAPPHSRPPGSR